MNINESKLEEIIEEEIDFLINAAKKSFKEIEVFIHDSVKFDRDFSTNENLISLGDQLFKYKAKLNALVKFRDTIFPCFIPKDFENKILHTVIDFKLYESHWFLRILERIYKECT
jgi:hypothetical protein